MFIANAVENYSLKLRKYYDLINELSVIGKISLSFIMAISIGLLAQIRIFLPWTPVPLVLTQIGILTSAAVMGKKWGIVPTLMYVLGGAAGIPWFSSYGGGISYLLGPTGGYLLGFILSAWFVAFMCNKAQITGKIIPLTLVVIFSQLVIIYLPGLLQLNLWFRAFGNQTPSIHNLLTMGFYPFIIGDILKSIVSVVIIYTYGRR